MRYIYIFISAFILTLVFLLMLSTTAYANVWITSSIYSHHQDVNAHYRENNTGIGLAYQQNNDTTIYVGSYMNSINKRSNYIGYAWQPWQYGFMKAGIITTILTGYEYDLVVLPIPMLSYENKNHGVNFIYVPTIGYAVQFKVLLK